MATLLNSGRHAELERHARMLLEQYPQSGLVWKLLCIALQTQGKNALGALQKAAVSLPNDAEIHNNLGLSLQAHGQYAEAVASLRRALVLAPDFFEAHANLGNALKDLGQLDAAVASYRRALEINPNIAEIHSNLGAVLHELQRFDEAVASHRRALELNPKYAAAHNNLGNVLRDMGRLDQAAESFRKALIIQPGYADAYNNLGVTQQALGQYHDAISSLNKALEINLGDADVYNNMGRVLKELGRFDDAMACYHKALEIKPNFFEASNNLGLLLQSVGHLDAALGCYSQALMINPDYAEAHNNLGNTLKDIGRLGEAIDSYHRALELKPDFAKVHSNLLFALNYSANHAPAYRIEEARRFGRMIAGKVTNRFQVWQCERQPTRIRVGILSGDLRRHPVGYFLENLLANLDPDRIELFAYPTFRQTDELTDRLKPRFAAWKPLYDLNDEAAAHLIHSDGVHVLLDLSGHTAKNRLPMLAWKPAPVQASWLGYFATTGVAEMDYFLADEAGVPNPQREHFTERVWYLPDTRWCFTPPDVDLPVASLPAMKNGYLSFGCFQNLAKVEDGVLMAWGAILDAMPMARLRWQCRQFGDPVVVAHCVERLQRHGIDTARVTLQGPASRSDYLAAYAEVDVILDTFPFTGGTTTCEALWMGVPTLSLAGETLVARQGASLLTAAGLQEWIAISESDYVEKAMSLTRDILKLANLRAGLRAQVLASPIFDAPRFARNFEAALWGMWQQWQERQ